MESCEICGELHPWRGTVVERCATSAKESLPELPPEMWAEIFNHLPAFPLLKMRQVCRRWRDIVDHSLALVSKLRVTFSDVHNPIDGSFEPKHLPRVPNAYLVSFVTEVGPWWASFGEGLTTLEFGSGSEIKSSVFLDILRHTPNLRVLDLPLVEFIDDFSTLPDFRLDKLEELRAHYIDVPEMFDVYRVLCGCGLKSLTVMWPDYHDCRSVEPLKAAHFVRGFQTTLAELHINGSDELLTEMVTFDRLKLRKLRLTYEELSNGWLLVNLCRKQPLLEYLAVDEGFKFNQESVVMLNQIGHLLPKLTYLSIKVAPFVDLTFLFNFANLHTLELYGDHENFSLVQFAFSGNDNPNLNTLHLDKIHFQKCVFQQFLNKLPNIRTISLRNCKFNAQSDLFEALVSLKHLNKLTLDIQETGCSSPATPLATLKHLRIRSCEMSRKLFASFLASCPHLRELWLNSRQAVHVEEVLAAISLQILPQLAVLTLLTRPMTKEAKYYVRYVCRALEKVEIGLEF
ncbi:conserved hypothetical protein [Culex quinquefasciatus]|uniref:F-box domain-containing protein n=1 Tax=Culex quinquefasciatus TaxID=7176 RepID=B0WXX1_CULQU|nr:conserved hypothetical protein [Culex quinquefasciatus]|eukprot:XP_001862243.1 conserved hypothetical protein [Culex quinquefasciatus]